MTGCTVVISNKIFSEQIILLVTKKDTIIGTKQETETRI